ncbi:MAG: RDD family protein [Pseudomonadota bacterium]
MSLKARRAARKARRAEKHRAAGRILSPEGVELALPIAGIGARLGAQIVDVLITSAFLAAIMILLAFSGASNPNTLGALGALLFFIIRIPYYILSELAWNGQTLGKKFLKIKVISHVGGPLTTHALVMRNMMKEAEVFLPGTLLLTLTAANPTASAVALAWVVMAFAIPLSNPHRMRLGDMLAGTHVVTLEEPILLADMAQTRLQTNIAAPGKFVFLPHQLDHYGRFELQTLETILRAQQRSVGPKDHARNAETLASIVDRIRKKIGYADKVEKADYVAFLQAFYNAQRSYLEQRQLFGDRRSDKHHSADTDAQTQKK